MSTENEKEITVGGAIAHLSGVSRPEDEFGHTKSDRDRLSDAELKAMGVEPDGDPDLTLVWTFVGLLVLVVVIAGGVGTYFTHAARVAVDDRNHGRGPELLAETRSAGQAELSKAGPVDAGRRTYQMSITDGMQAVIKNPRLLQMHPLGTPDPASQPRVPAAAPALQPAPTGAAPTGAAPTGAAPVLQLQRPTLGTDRAVSPSLGGSPTLQLRPAGR